MYPTDLLTNDLVLLSSKAVLAEALLKFNITFSSCESPLYSTVVKV